MSAQRERDERAEPIDAKDPMESSEQAEPIEPIERTEPTLPIDRIEPFEPIERKEFSDHRERREVSAGVDISSVCRIRRMGCWSACAKREDGAAHS